MAFFQRFKKLTALLLCGMLMLGGCGKDSSDADPTQVSGQNPGSDASQPSGSRSDQESSQSPGSQDNAVSDTEQLMAYKDIRYLPKFTDLSEKYNAFASRGIGFVDSAFYLVARDMSGNNISGGKLVVYSPESGEEKVLLEDAGMLAAALLEDGSVMVLSQNPDAGYRLCKLDGEGNEIFSKDCSNLELSDGLNPTFVADSQGRCYLQTHDNIILFNEEGEVSGKVNLSGKLVTQTVCDNSGKVYIYDYYTSQLIPVDFETASLEDSAYSMPIRTLRAIAAANTEDFLVCDDTTVYRYKYEEGALTPLFDLQDSQIPNAYCIDVIQEMEDGRVCLFSRDEGQYISEVAILTPTPLSECPVKEVVTIGVVDPGTDLLYSVAQFNRQSEDFSVSILNYTMGGKTYREAREAIKFDLSIGKGPDICTVDYLDEPEILFSSGCFIDLSDYLDGSLQYTEEDFIRQALDIYTYQGQLMAIPKYFSLRTIIASPDMVGDAVGWDLEDVKAVVHANPDAVIFDQASSAYMLDVCIRNMMDKFVDFDKKEAAFDSPEYIEFLNFLKELPDNYDDREYTRYRNEWLRTGKTLFSIRDINRLTDLQVVEANFGGKYTCIGYPSPDKEPDCIIMGYEAYAISASSSNKDLAWKFLEWNHSRQGESGSSLISMAGFPTRIDAFEREMDQSDVVEEDMGGIQFSDGTYVQYRKAEPWEIELLRSLIDISSPQKRMEGTIVEIIEEEAADLLNGNKSAEDVAKVTQNRVQLYLDEG